MPALDRDLFDADSISALIEDLGALLAEIGAEPDAPILALKLSREQRTARRRTAGRTIARRPSK